jgi:hypothetical protein
MEVLAACHIHSSWSYDGSWSLEELSAKFQSRGYRIVMMTEHDRGFTVARFAEFREACAKASTDQLLMIPGIEYSDAENRVHVLVWGDVPFLGEGLPTLQMLKAVKAAGGVAVLAHPTRKGAWQCYQPQWAEFLLGVEVWNRKYDGWAPSETAPSLVSSANAVPFVGLDFHTHRQLFSLGMSLELSEVTEQAVLAAMRARRCNARVFGAPLAQAFDNLLPTLRLAERGRRTAIKIVKRRGAFAR